MTPWPWLIGLGLIAASQAGPRPAGLLRSGMRLVYESGGQRSDWLVDSAGADSAASCGRALIVIGGNRDRRRDCVEAGALQRWNEREGRWVEQRPLVPSSTRRYSRPGGVVIEFATGPESVDTISGVPVAVVPTTVTTFDSTGAIRRRLRERYAVQLTTATWGVFEVPDGTGWRVEREFRLVAMEAGTARR